LDEGRRTPTPSGSASGYTLSFFGSEDESPFDQVGYDGYAPRPLHDPVGNALVGRVHDLVHHSGCAIEPIDGILAL
jgi:hypothetical protein